MKVVFLLTQDRGGPADLTTSLAVELAGRANSPDVIILGPASVADAGLPRSLLLPVHVQSKADARGYSAVSDLLKELSPDIIHAQDRRAGLVSALVADWKTPIVLTFHGVPDNAAGHWVQAGPLRGRRPEATVSEHDVRPLQPRDSSHWPASTESVGAGCSFSINSSLGLLMEQSVRFPTMRQRWALGGEVA